MRELFIILAVFLITTQDAPHRDTVKEDTANIVVARKQIRETKSVLKTQQATLDSLLRIKKDTIKK